MAKSLHDMTSEELGKLFPIRIVPYQTEWPRLYESKKREICDILGPLASRIEHFGSTAVPNLSAKPTIDILVAIQEGTEKEVVRRFEHAGYECIHRKDSPPPYWMCVQGYSPDGFRGQCYHMHIAPESHRGLWDRLFFRDYLIKHQEIAREYELLKLELAQKHEFHREKYTDGKEEFVKHITARALEERVN